MELSSIWFWFRGHVTIYYHELTDKPKEGENVNMCKAVEQMVEANRKEDKKEIIRLTKAISKAEEVANKATKAANKATEAAFKAEEKSRRDKERADIATSKLDALEKYLKENQISVPSELLSLSWQRKWELEKATINVVAFSFFVLPLFNFNESKWRRTTVATIARLHFSHSFSVVRQRSAPSA